VNATFYASSILGVPLDTITSIALDSSGNVILAGTAVPAFPVPSSALQSSFPSYESPAYATYAGYVAKLNSTGSKFLFSTWLGDATSGPNALALDNKGAIWITGGATPASLPPSTGNPILGGNYIAGLSSDGSSLISLFTAPNSAAGTAIQATATSIGTLGASGTLLISSATAGSSILGIAASPAFTAANAIVARELVSFYGTGFGSTPTVLFDGMPAWLTYASDTQINAVVPSALAGREIPRSRS